MSLKRIVFLLVFAAVAYFGAHYFLGNEGGDYKTVGSVSSNFGSQMKSSYRSFEGTKYRTIALLEGNIFHLEAEVKTTKGDLALSLIDPTGNVLFSVSNPEDPIVENIEIKVTGEYRLQVEGEHEGSYELDWEVR